MKEWINKTMCVWHCTWKYEISTSPFFYSIWAQVTLYAQFIWRSLPHRFRGQADCWLPMYKGFCFHAGDSSVGLASLVSNKGAGFLEELMEPTVWQPKDTKGIGAWGMGRNLKRGSHRASFDSPQRLAILRLWTYFRSCIGSRWS